MKATLLATALLVSLAAHGKEAKPQETGLDTSWPDYPKFFRAPMNDKSKPNAALWITGEGKGKTTVVVYFHGWRNCVNNVAYGRGCGRPAAPERGLINVFRSAKIPGDTVFAVLEGPFLEELTLAPSSMAAPPAFMRGKTSPVPVTQGFFRDLVDKILLAANRGGIRNLDSVVLAGHSGAGGIIAAALDFGGLDDRIKSVVLLDATYIDLSAQLQKWRSARGSSQADLHVAFRPGDSETGAKKIQSLATSYKRDPMVAHDNYPDTYLAPLLKASFGVGQSAAATASRPAPAKPTATNKPKPKSRW
jgi:hypothetical protein